MGGRGPGTTLLAMRLAAAAGLLVALRLPGADGWSSAHSPISAHALAAQPPELVRLFATTRAHFLGSVGTLEQWFAGGLWPQAISFSLCGDLIAGPCLGGDTPCQPRQLRMKLALREFAYAEGPNATRVKPWPLDVPACNGTNAPLCIPVPKPSGNGSDPVPWLCKRKDITESHF